MQNNNQNKQINFKNHTQMGLLKRINTATPITKGAVNALKSTTSRPIKPKAFSKYHKKDAFIGSHQENTLALEVVSENDINKSVKLFLHNPYTLGLAVKDGMHKDGTPKIKSEKVAILSDIDGNLFLVPGEGNTLATSTTRGTIKNMRSVAHYIIQHKPVIDFSISNKYLFDVSTELVEFSFVTDEQTMLKGYALTLVRDENKELEQYVKDMAIYTAIKNGQPIPEEYQEVELDAEVKAFDASEPVDSEDEDIFA